MGYVLPTLRAFLSSQPRLIQVSTPDEQFSSSGTHVIVTNIPRYGFGLAFAPEAIPDDGLLNIRVYHGSTRWQIFWHAVRLKLGLPIRANECTRFAAASVLLESNSGGPDSMVQADGDPCGTLPVMVEIQAKSLCLIVR